MADEIDALQVDVDHLVPLGLGRRLDRAVALDAGIVGDNVDAAERPDHFGHGSFDLGSD